MKQIDDFKNIVDTYLKEKGYSVGEKTKWENKSVTLNCPIGQKIRIG